MTFFIYKLFGEPCHLLFTYLVSRAEVKSRVMWVIIILQLLQLTFRGLCSLLCFKLTQVQEMHRWQSSWWGCSTCIGIDHWILSCDLSVCRLLTSAQYLYPLISFKCPSFALKTLLVRSMWKKLSWLLKRPQLLSTIDASNVVTSFIEIIAKFYRFYWVAKIKSLPHLMFSLVN